MSEPWQTAAPPGDDVYDPDRPVDTCAAPTGPAFSDVPVAVPGPGADVTGATRVTVPPGPDLDGVTASSSPRSVGDEPATREPGFPRRQG